MNRVLIVGELSKDPVMTEIGCCKMEIMADEDVFNFKTKETKIEICPFDVEVWGETAKNCIKFLKAGRKVLIDGRLVKINSGRGYFLFAKEIVFLDNPDR